MRGATCIFKAGFDRELLSDPNSKSNRQHECRALEIAGARYSGTGVMLGRYLASPRMIGVCCRMEMKCGKVNVVYSSWQK